MASHARSLAAGVVRGKGIKVECTITINRPAPELFRFWRDFENLPRFLLHLKSVRMIDEVRSHWVVVAPTGTDLGWDATIHTEIQNELIAWRSLEGADVKNTGSVHFTPSPMGRGTQMRVAMTYEPPAGKLGRFIARMLGEDPGLQVRTDLRRFKALMETGEIPTTEGQSSGRWEAQQRAAVGSTPAAVVIRADWDAPVSADGRMS